MARRNSDYDRVHREKERSPLAYMLCAKFYHRTSDAP